jgi:hypothetical protein
MPNRQFLPVCFRNRVILTAPPLRFVKSRLEEEERKNNRGHYTTHRVLLHAPLQNRLSESRLMPAVVVRQPPTTCKCLSANCRELHTPQASMSPLGTTFSNRYFVHERIGLISTVSSRIRSSGGVAAISRSASLLLLLRTIGRRPMPASSLTDPVPSRGSQPM